MSITTQYSVDCSAALGSHGAAVPRRGADFAENNILKGSFFSDTDTS